MRKVFTMLMLVVFACSVFAGGYQVRLQGQKQTGLALIGTPFAYGASSNFYNPGALSFMKNKYDFSVGVSGIMSKVAFQKSASDYQASTDNPLGTPFYVYGAGKITDKFTVGLGVYTPYGSTSKWTDDWAGRALIQESSLKAIFYQATVSYKVTDWFGIGIGFVFATGTVDLQRGLVYNNTSTVRLEGNTTNYGFNIGGYFHPTEKIRFGFDYRSQIDLKVEDGDATFTIPASLQTTIAPTNKFSAELPTPANLDIGVAYDVTEAFTLALEFAWVQWSAYENLDFTFKDNGETLNSNNPRNYKDSFVTRFGGMYKLKDKFVFRAGLYYDPTPTDEKYFTPETVSLNTLAFTLGVSYMPIENLSIDISYLQTNGFEAEKSYEPANFSGTYKSVAYIPGIGVSYSF